MVKEATERVQQMEQYFEMMQKVANTNPDRFFWDDSVKEILHTLKEYYEGGQWMMDYELDEKGFFPKEMKRGVLSQDSLYNLLEEIKK